MNRPALFDCNETLVDSQHSICACMARAARKERKGERRKRGPG